MRVLVSGASGLVGTHLMRALEGAGHEAVALVRRPVRDAKREIRWRPSRGEIDAAAISGFDGVIHLAGRSLATRWSERSKQQILDSRVDSGELLAQTVARKKNKPAVYISASAIGYYGDRGDREVDETASPGDGFLADVCMDWEEAARPAEQAGIRTCFARFGLILAASGGLLTPLRLSTQLGLGASFGDGRQIMSWVHIDDVVGALLHMLEIESLAGPVNITAPNPVQNRELIRSLGRVLNRPTFLRIPAGVLKLLAGREQAEQMLLASQRVAPARLHESGYDFAYPTLEPALTNLLR